MISLEEVFPDLPRPGWPGRRRAIARAALETLAAGTVLVLLIVAVLSWGAIAVALGVPPR